MSKMVAVTYLDINSLSAQSSHLTPWNPQTLCIGHACKHISRLTIDDGVVTTGFHGDRGIARSFRELRP